MLVCAVSNCTESLCCTKGCMLTKTCKRTCSVRGCNAWCCTVSRCTLLWRCMWVCSVSVCSVWGCSGTACGMLVCTVNCVCTLTLGHGSCTSFLQWWQLCFPLCCQPRRQEVRNPRETHQSNKRSGILCSVSLFFLLFSFAYYPFSVQLEYLLLLL